MVEYTFIYVWLYQEKTSKCTFKLSIFYLLKILENAHTKYFHTRTILLREIITLGVSSLLQPYSESHFVQFLHRLLFSHALYKHANHSNVEIVAIEIMMK